MYKYRLLCLVYNIRGGRRTSERAGLLCTVSREKVRRKEIGLVSKRRTDKRAVDMPASSISISLSFVISLLRSFAPKRQCKCENIVWCKAYLSPDTTEAPGTHATKVNVPIVISSSMLRAISGTGGYSRIDSWKRNIVTCVSSSFFLRFVFLSTFLPR